MPGMMDTILNLGLNDETVVALAKNSGNERFAFDSYRRFILMFTNIAKGHPRTEMDKMLDDIKEKNGYKLDTQVTVDQFKDLVKLTRSITRASSAKTSRLIRMSSSKRPSRPSSVAGTTRALTSIVR
jgi:pyruvate,orthophosphate dikinase